MLEPRKGIFANCRNSAQAEKSRERESEMTTATITTLHENDPWQTAGNVYDDTLGVFQEVMVGRDEMFKAMFCSLVSGGHILFEGDAGTGKTAGAKTFARQLNVGFSRIQFTPDLMPMGITGGGRYNPMTGEVKFHEGPIFANVVLGDEINRASPKTQAALLEAMEEACVTYDGEPHYLPNPHIFIATQNGIEYEGTNPLPRNQEDRFLMWFPMERLKDEVQLKEVARRNLNGGVEIDPMSMLSSELIVELRKLRRRTKVESLLGYISKLMTAVDAHPSVETGPGERAVIAMAKVSQAHAMINSRSGVLAEDVREFAPNVLMHRVRLTADAEEAGTSTGSVIKEVVDSLTAPKAA